MFDVLFAKDKLGRIKVWEVSVSSMEDGTASFTITHGLECGKKTSTTREVLVGKNIGKANETTPYEQAVSEAKSRWNKQVDKGYRGSIDEIKMPHEVEFFLPMLADRYDKRKKKITWPAYCQAKLDGFRCLSRKENGTVTLWSRKGKVFDVPKELIEELNTVMEDGDCFDGEIYVHEWRSPSNETDFQRISAATKKHRDDTSRLQYHIYDRPAFKKTFKERFVDVDFKETERVRRVETRLVQSEAEMLELYERYISGDLPYEGLMVRNVLGEYLFSHRSTDLLKVKPLDDAEFRIVGGSEATGDDAGTVVFRCVAENGEEFDVRPKGSRTLRREYWDNLNEYVGQWLTVEFNGRANSGKPRFPRGTKIRPSWDVDLPTEEKPEGRTSGKILKGGFNPFS